MANFSMPASEHHRWAKPAPIAGQNPDALEIMNNLPNAA